MPGARKAVETLRRFPILAELSDSELAFFLAHAVAVDIDRGEYLFREGDPGDALYLLSEGMVVAEATVDATLGTRKDLALLPASSFVGEMALADDSLRSASIRAEIPSRALRISAAQFAEVTAKNPSIASKVFRALFAETSQRLRATNEELLAVYEVGKLVAEAGNPQQVAATILARLRQRLSASYLAVALYDPTRNELRVSHASGARSTELLDSFIPLSSGLAARAFDERRPFLLERLLGATEPWESESMLLCPLVVRDRAIGLLLVGVAEHGRPFASSDLSLTSAVANISAALLVEAFGSK